jgi:hypothetical protein
MKRHRSLVPLSRDHHDALRQGDGFDTFARRRNSFFRLFSISLRPVSRLFRPSSSTCASTR